MPSLSPEQIIAGHRAALRRVRGGVDAFAQAAWVAQGSYRDADAARLSRLIVPRVQAGQLTVANLTSAYIASIATVRLGRTIAPVPVSRDGILGARGVPADEVYRRPVAAVHRELAAGASYRDAVTRGATYLGVLIATDSQMAQVRQSRSSYTRRGVERFRRVLEGGKNCDLCIVASEQPYWSGDLMPIHAGCQCSTQPVGPGDEGTGIVDVGSLADPQTRLAIRQHGEIGPVLTNAAHHFTGVDDPLA